jgi:hypothetical protein
MDEREQEELDEEGNVERKYVSVELIQDIKEVRLKMELASCVDPRERSEPGAKNLS